MSEFAYYISIPYGAIKRQMPYWANGKTQRFQFLMVRLKEFARSRNDRRSEVISIPYGAIKRVKISVAVGLEPTFQFLMVRLKDADNGKLAGTYVYFNSLWCD